MTAYPALQSGFVGFDAKGYVLPDPTEPTARQSIMFRDYAAPLVNYHYSKDVTSMFASWCANPDVLRQFEFRERLLKLVFAYFGKHLYKWLDIQTMTNALSSLHGKFIMETLEYIVNDVPRRTKNVQWINLLIAEERAKAVPVRVEEFMKLRSSTNVRTIVPNEMTEMVVKWTSKRDGFEDLLITMFVIFGSRNGIRSVDNVAG